MTALASYRIHIAEILAGGTALVCFAGWLAGRIDEREFRTVTMAPLRYEARVIDLDDYRPVVVMPEFHDWAVDAPELA